MTNKEKYYKLALNILNSDFKNFVLQNNILTEIDIPIDDSREYWLALNLQPMREISLFERVSCYPFLRAPEESPKKINKIIRRIRESGNKALLKGIE